MVQARHSLGTRVHVALRHADLDRELAAGTSPTASPDHELRARQLLGHRVRRELACDIDSVLARAEHPPHWHSALLPVQAAAVRAARPELVTLRDALLDESRASYRAVALAVLLLHDPHGPIYVPGESSVAELAGAANVAFDADSPPSAGTARAAAAPTSNISTP
jgi:hypothetical protein